MENTLYKRNIAYRVRTISNKNFLFGENQCFELNEVAVLVWNNLNGERNIENIVSEISEQYDADKEIILKDVNEFIEEMKENNVILEMK